MREYMHLIESYIAELSLFEIEAHDRDDRFAQNMDRMHDRPKCAFWITKSDFDFVPKHGIHDDLSYNIGGLFNALQAGWLRCTMINHGQELHIEMAATPKARPAITAFKAYMMQMDMLKLIRVEVHAVDADGKVDRSKTAKQMVFGDPSKAYSALGSATIQRGARKAAA